MPRTPSLALLAVLLVVLPATLAGCGGGGGGEAIPSAAYATLIYQTAATGWPDVFAIPDTDDPAIMAVALLDPVQVPTVDGTATSRVRVVAVPLPDSGLIPDNPITVSVSVTRAGGLVSLSASLMGIELLSLPDLVLSVGGIADGTLTEGDDTLRYLAYPWADETSSALLGDWAATGFDDAASLTVTAVDDAAISATIDSRVFTGRRVGDAAFLVGSGTPDALMVLEDLGDSARGYQTSGGAGDPVAFDAFTLSRP